MNPYLGEIRIFAGNYAPVGWAKCDGQMLSISEYEALYALLGTTYGGDGTTQFGLPDLRGRIPVHMGSSYVLGALAGTETVTLLSQQMPAHSHTPQAGTNVGTSSTPNGQLWAANTEDSYSTNSQSLVPMHPQAIGFAGGNQPHENMMPSLALTFIIALEGVFPTQD